jgi:hypothetical protein
LGALSLISLERKISQFAKYMSLCFAGFAIFCLVDLYLSPVSEIQYVLAHESETGVRGKSGSKYATYLYRDNYLHTINFCAHQPYRLRAKEFDTLLVYESVNNRTAEAEAVLLDHKSERSKKNEPIKSMFTSEDLVVEKVPVDLKSFYALEDGDSIRLFFSPWRHKLVEYLTLEIQGWKSISFDELKQNEVVHDDLKQWNLTTLVFGYIVLALTSLTWIIKPFEYSVGIFVFNVIISALLNWIY